MESQISQWDCSRCTFINPGLSKCCDVCSKPKAAEPEIGIMEEAPPAYNAKARLAYNAKAPPAYNAEAPLAYNAVPQQQQLTPQLQYTQCVELQVAPTDNNLVPSAPIEQYIPKDDNHKWINDDELPPDYQSIIAGEQEQKEAPKQGMGCIGGCLASPHLKAWFFTLLVLFFIFCYFICLATLSNMCSCDCSYSFSDPCSETDIDSCSEYDIECGFPCSMTYVLGGGFWGIVAAAYALYLCEAFFCSSSFKYLNNIHEQETIYKYIERLHTYPPNIWWKVECYHYETRTQTTTDSNGNTTTQTYQVKVVTHTASSNYVYNSWRDVSVPMTGLLDEWNLTKLKNYKTFTFANVETQNDYNYKAAQFRRNNDFDTFQNFWYGVEIQDFKSKMLVEVQPGAKSQTISLQCYIFSSLALGTTCFRMHFASVCGRKKYVFNKQVCI